MKTSVKKITKVKSTNKTNRNALLQMLTDKKIISKHLQNGGNFDDLKKQGYKFATV